MTQAQRQKRQEATLFVATTLTIYVELFLRTKDSGFYSMPFLGFFKLMASAVGAGLVKPIVCQIVRWFRS